MEGRDALQQNTHQKFVVNGNHGWHVDGPNGQPVAVAAGRRRALAKWTCVGQSPRFLKAARMPGANPQGCLAGWELGELGRDGATTIPEKVTVISITLLGKYRVDATVNKENMLQRYHTWVPDPVLGDMNYEHEITTRATPI